MKYHYLIITLLCISFSYGQNNTVEGDIEGFKLYPNPVTEGKVFIGTSENSPKRIAIYDVLGNQVLETSISGDELQVSELDAGVYVLRVFQNNKVVTRKLIVK